MDTDPLIEQINQTCERQRAIFLEITDRILRQAMTPNEAVTSADQERDAIERVMAKEFASTGEAALLVGCSAQHLRNLVQKAMDKKAECPIPYRDLDGPVVFPVMELLEWTRLPKTRSKRSGKKNKTTLRVAR